MHRRYTTRGVAAAISDIDEAEDNETEGMLAAQNEQEKGPVLEEEMSNIKEEISAADFVDETKEPQQTEDELNEDNKDFEISLCHLLVIIG